MKKTILVLLLIMTATAVSAQQKNDENFSKRLFEARLAEVSLRLNLSDEQKTKFAPLYEQFCNDMKELRGKHREGFPGGPGMRAGGPGMQPGERRMRPEGNGMYQGRPSKPKMDKEKKDRKESPEDKERKDKKDIKDGKDNKERLSDADMLKHMKDRMERQKKMQEICLEYTDKFASVLSDRQIIEFFEVENEIQDKLQNRAFNARPQKNK